MSSTHLDNSSFQANNHKEHRNHIALKLLAEGSVVVLAMALGWGMWNLGSYTLLSQTQPEPIYVAGYPVPDPLEKDSARRGGFGKGRGCSKEGASHPVTSRRPGAGLGEHGHGAERQRGDKLPSRTSSENMSSRH